MANGGILDHIARAIIGLLLTAYAIAFGLASTGWNWGRLDRHCSDCYGRDPMRLTGCSAFPLARRSPTSTEWGLMLYRRLRAMKSWPETTMERTAQLRNLRSAAPEVMKAFANIAQSALAPRALDRKTKELIAVGISVAIKCDDCIGFHVKAALDQGASQQEVIEALSMAIYMGAGPSVMYATHALDAYAQFASGNANAQPAPASREAPGSA
jgi:AhpD family alkylhydroperoxidase